MVWAKKIQKGLLREFFGIKFDPATFGRLDMLNPKFLDFYTLGTFLGMFKGLLTFWGPKNAQNFDFFRVHQNRVRFENFWQNSKNPVWKPCFKRNFFSLGSFSCTHMYLAIWGIN